jgi:hypothetical protein
MFLKFCLLSYQVIDAGYTVHQVVIDALAENEEKGMESAWEGGRERGL